MVTAIITTYCREIDIIDRAVRSIKNQTYPEIELLIVDDNDPSSQYSIDLVKYCQENSIKYLSQGENKGACSARNYGIENASGKYIAFLDDDDEWLPDKIMMQVQAIEMDETIGLVYCGGYIYNESDGSKTDYFNVATFKDVVTFEDMLYLDYVGSTSQPLIRKECFDAVGGFWTEQPARQDYEMWIRISKQFKIVGIKEKLFNHYIHNGEQISKSSDKSYRGFLNIYNRYKADYNKKENFPAYKNMINRLYFWSKGVKPLVNIKYGVMKLLLMIRSM